MRFSLFFFFLIFAIGFGFAQAAIQYSVKLDNIRHHEIRVSVKFSELPAGAFLIRMPSASPGRYAQHNFAKNVFNVSAKDEKGEMLVIGKKDIDLWEVEAHNGFVEFQYTLYANHGDGTYSGVDNRKLHLNMPATFVYGENLEDRPVILTFDLTDYPEWKVATQLETTGKNTFKAPNYYYFYDSPVFVGEIDFRRWQSQSGKNSYIIELAAIHEGTTEELDQYTEWVKKVVEEEKAIYGGLPAFDYGRYTFLVSYNPWVFGDGMEHRNSTICSSKGSLEKNAKGLIGTIAHEFFHAWNVERLRPRSLEPFDFSRPNMSDALWFAEGFTSYYDDLVLCRAGINTEEKFVKSLTNGVNFVLNSGGRDYRNPIQMSMHAPFVDDATAIDETNFAQTFVSYYTYGAVLGLALDLSIRVKFPGKSLDDLMQYLWNKYGKTEIPYEIADLEKALAEVTGDPTFAKDFFNRSIYNSELPDLKKLLAEFAINLEPKNPEKLELQTIKLRYTPQGGQIANTLTKNSSLYKAGLNKRDVLLSIAGQEIKNKEDFKTALASIKMGQSYPITFRQNGKKYTTSLVATVDPSIKISLAEKPTQKAVEKRKEWLRSKAQ